MKIGIGLPNPVPGTSGAAVLEFARRAEQRGFDAVATIDRIAYPSYDTLATLAAVAAATSRIGLVSNILLAPLYPAAQLAKSAASIDQFSGGRLTLGLGVGGRADDFELAGRDIDRRGRDMDESLELIHRAWSGEKFGDGQPICPTPIQDGRVPVLVGGTSDAAFRRLVQWGAGLTIAGSPPDQAAGLTRRAREAWERAGRSGEPRLAALTYFSVGDEVAEASRVYLRDYYGFVGPYADQIAEGALRTPEAIRDAVSAYADAGCTELYLDATVGDPEQADRLADIVL